MKILRKPVQHWLIRIFSFFFALWSRGDGTFRLAEFLSQSCDFDNFVVLITFTVSQVWIKWLFYYSSFGKSFKLVQSHVRWIEKKKEKQTLNWIKSHVNIKDYGAKKMQDIWDELMRGIRKERKKQFLFILEMIGIFNQLRTSMSFSGYYVVLHLPKNIQNKNITFSCDSEQFNLIACHLTFSLEFRTTFRRNCYGKIETKRMGR